MGFLFFFFFHNRKLHRVNKIHLFPLIEAGKEARKKEVGVEVIIINFFFLARYTQICVHKG